MGEVIDMNAKKPHLTMTALNGRVHVIPLSFFEDVSKGSQSLKELDFFDQLVPVIIGEWLENLNT